MLTTRPGLIGLRKGYLQPRSQGLSSLTLGTRLGYLDKVSPIHKVHAAFPRMQHAQELQGLNKGEDKMTCEDFKDELLDKLNELRETNVLCDTTLRAEGQDFAAHKCVLSAASPYFRALFTSQMKETKNNMVELQEAKSTTVSDVLQFIYTGKVSVDSSNAQDLAKIADYLIIPSLKTKASLCLQGSISASNCLALESFASCYNCESLQQAAVTYKCENFVAVTKSEDFSRLDVEKVKELICMDEINVSEEDDVYQAVISWIKCDLPSRECFLPELLKCVRLFSVSKYSLRRILDEELVSKNPACTRLVINALDFCLFPDRFQDMPLKPRLSLDKYEQVVVLTGGDDGVGWKMETDGFVPSTKTWVSLPRMPDSCIEGSAAVCGGILYVMGVEMENAMCCFNPKRNEWSSHRGALNVKSCSVTCFNEKLYVIGGMACWNDNKIYDPVLDEWKTAASMETGHANHSAVVLQEHIYVIAGHDASDCQNSVECYDPLTDQWSRISNLSKARMCAAATTAGEKILIVGGFGDMTARTIEPSCEIYDPITNQWNLVSSPCSPRAACSAVSIDDIVYLFGGGNERYFMETVECFDFKRNTWYEIETERMPNPCTGLQASLLKFPKKFI